MSPSICQQIADLKFWSGFVIGFGATALGLPLLVGIACTVFQTGFSLNVGVRRPTP